MTFSYFRVYSRWATLLLPLTIALAACSADKGPKYPDANSYCSARAGAECNGEVIKACALPDATHCIAQRQAVCVAALPTGTTYNSGGAEPCINAVASAYADAKVTEGENHAVLAACALVSDGPGAANATCRADIDCKVSAGLHCVIGGGASTGTCQIPESVQGGGSCVSPSQRCIDGFHCGSSHHCDISGQVAEPCSVSLPCVETARCSAASVCESKSADGTACTNANECLHGICATATGTAQGLCVSQMTLAPNEPFCVAARQ